MIDWCQFLSFVSHITVLCSEEEPNQEQFEKFNRFLLTQYSSADLIICSPVTDKLSELNGKPYLSIDINSLNENVLKDAIFNLIVQKRMLFMTPETVSKYSYNVISKKMKNKLQTNKENFYEESMSNYAYQKKSEAIEYFHKLLQGYKNSIYLKAKSSENFESFKFQEHLSILIDKSLKFHFLNIYSELWTKKDVLDIAIIIRNEISNDFEAEIKDIKPIEPLCILYSLVKSGINESSYLQAQKLADEISKTKSIFQLKNPKISSDLNPESIHNFEKNVIDEHNRVIKTAFAKEEMQQEKESIAQEFNNFFEQNPTASDEEYKSFYNNMKSKYCSDENPFISNYFDNMSKVRPASIQMESSIEHEPLVDQISQQEDYQNIKSNQDEEQKPVIPEVNDNEEITIKIDQKSFSNAHINVQPERIKTNIDMNRTCHELFEIVKNLFTLNMIPFYMTRIANNSNNDPIEIQVFNDLNPISTLNSHYFTVYYGETVYSTKTFIESLTNARTIRISDDFIIKTNSTSSNYKVTFPANHNGWFNVSFNITNDSPTRNTDKALIILTLNNEETSYLQEGNALLHRYLQGDTWITDEQEVFLSFPDCKKAIFLLNHCSDHKIEPRDTKLESLIPENCKNGNFSRDWEGMNADQSFPRGGRPYYVPIGYLSVGIKVNSFDENTCVAFHGTKALSVSGIVMNGFKTPKEYKGVFEGHIKLDREVYGIKDFANAIFVSPSIKYSSMYGKSEIIASGPDGCCVASGHIEQNKIRILILQVRVKPNAFSINENTTLSSFKDSHYEDGELEWRIGNSSDLFPYRLLYKHVTPDDFYSSLSSI